MSHSYYIPTTTSTWTGHVKLRRTSYDEKFYAFSVRVQIFEV